MLPVVAILGRPNVGKSTLFNRLIGERKALVDDRPGVTRDRNHGTGFLGEREMVFIDTGGLDPEPGDDLFAAIRVQAEAAIAEADLVLFVVDRQAGLTPADKLAADLLRRWVQSAKGEEKGRIILLVNKCDGPRHDEEGAEFWALGIEPLLTISAEHGRGLYELEEAVLARLPEPSEDVGQDDEDEIRVAVIGRPNIGKSTLVNRLIGEERHVVHDAPGTTTDAIDSVIKVGGQTLRIVDTAGVRRKSRIDDRVETFATARAIRTIERCHVTLLMIDGVEGVTGQDAKLAQLVHERGRAAIIVINKWDLVQKMPDRHSGVLEDELKRRLPHLDWAPVLYISARTGKGCGHILNLIAEVFQNFNLRVPTSPLNDFLERATTQNPPPQRQQHPVKLNYITQHRVRPPSFIAWSNTPEGITTSYLRYLENQMRAAFGFQGSPIRIELRKKRKPGEPKGGSEP